MPTAQNSDPYHRAATKTGLCQDIDLLIYGYYYCTKNHPDEKLRQNFPYEWANRTPCEMRIEYG